MKMESWMQGVKAGYGFLLRGKETTKEYAGSAGNDARGEKRENEGENVFAEGDGEIGETISFRESLAEVKAQEGAGKGRDRAKKASFESGPVQTGSRKSSGEGAEGNAHDKGKGRGAIGSSG